MRKNKTNRDPTTNQKAKGSEKHDLLFKQSLDHKGDVNQEQLQPKTPRLLYSPVDRSYSAKLEGWDTMGNIFFLFVGLFRLFPVVG